MAKIKGPRKAAGKAARKAPSKAPRVTIKKVVELMKRHAPDNYEECERATGLRLTFLGSGCSRSTYHIEGTPLVVKFNRFAYDLQAHKEMRAIRKIKREPALKRLRKHVPKTYYFDKNKGHVLMEQCMTYSDDKEVKKIRAKFERSFGRGLDIHEDNLMHDRHGVLKVVDMGFFHVDDRPGRAAKAAKVKRA